MPDIDTWTTVSGQAATEPSMVDMAERIRGLAKDLEAKQREAQLRQLVGSLSVGEVLEAVLEGEKNPELAIANACADWWRKTMPPELLASCRSAANDLVDRLRKESENWEEAWLSAHSCILMSLVGLDDLASDHHGEAEESTP